MAVGADQIWRWNSTSATWTKYYWNTTNKCWADSTGKTATTDTVANGETVFFYRGTGASDTTITLSGGVTKFTATPVQENLVAAQYRFMAYPWPVDMKVANFASYQGAPKGAKSMAVGADQIWYWNSSTSTWTKFYYNSTNKCWALSTDKTATDATIPAGEGFFFYRGSGATTDTVTFKYE